MTENKLKTIKFKVQRYDSEKDRKVHMQEFIIPDIPGMTILEGLIYIKENIDGTLAFRTSCRMGICGSCGMLINNYPQLACHTQIKELNSTQVTVKPLPNFAIIKDLVTDFTLLFEKHKSIKPYIIRHDAKEMEEPTAEFTQKPEEMDTFEQFAYCIKCGICYASCPTTAQDKRFLGPQALAQCYHYSADNRDDGSQERASIADADHGVWHCHLAGACSEACPKGVDPALAMQLLKKRLALKALGLSRKTEASPVVPPPTEMKAKVPSPEFNIKKTQR
jgi:succinate dehydrogenase / fumarate reductase, iron-sulfur subunit